MGPTPVVIFVAVVGLVCGFVTLRMRAIRLFLIVAPLGIVARWVAPLLLSPTGGTGTFFATAFVLAVVSGFTDGWIVGGLLGYFGGENRDRRLARPPGWQGGGDRPT